MSNVTSPQLHISFDLAESLVHQLQDAARATGRDSLLQVARTLQAEIDSQVSLVQPEH
jgi:HPt (histidine-containing phosphotransfer) domain-containing protein